MAVNANCYKLITTSWTQTPSMFNARSQGNQLSSSRYKSLAIMAGGYSGSATVNEAMQQTTESSWTALSATFNQSETSAGEMNSFYYMDNAYSAQESGTLAAAGGQKFNGSSNTSFAGIHSTAAAEKGAAYSKNGFALYSMGAVQAGPAVADITRKINFADSGSTVTASGTTRNMCTVIYTLSKIFRAGGNGNGDYAAGSATVLSWNESAWTTETALLEATSQAFTGRYGDTGWLYSGGYSTAGSMVSSSRFFNGSSWSSLSALAAVTGGVGGSASA